MNYTLDGFSRLYALFVEYPTIKGFSVLKNYITELEKQELITKKGHSELRDDIDRILSNQLMENERKAFFLERKAVNND